MSKIMEDIFIGTPYQNFLKLTDCILTTEDGCKFKAHKIILAQRSKYFERLFCSGFRQSVETVVPDIKGDILSQILCYIYQKKDILSSESVSDILIASHFLMMDELFEDCKKLLLDGGISTSNCIAVFNTAWKIELKGIIASSKRFIEIHFEEAISQEGNKLGELNINAFTEILNCDNLNISDESIVWNAIVSWIDQNFSERMFYFQELLKYVRLQGLDETSTQNLNLPQIIEKNQFRFDPNQQLGDQITAISLMVKKAQTCTPSETGFRKSRIPNCIYVICKQVNNRKIELYLTYDNSLDYWISFGEVRRKIALHQVEVCNAGRLIYFLFYRSPIMIKGFDVIDGRWISVSPVSQGRYYYFIAAVKNDLFALGGVLPMGNTAPEDDSGTDEDGTDEDIDEEFENLDDIAIETDDDKNFVQYFDLRSNTWQQRRSMYLVHITGIVTLNDYIYVIGKSKNFESMVLQFYDPCQDCWTLLPEPNIFKTLCPPIAFCGNIYLIGGVDRYRCIKVQEYNPSLNTWNELPDLPYTYPELQVIVIENNMIVFDEQDVEDDSHPAVYWCKEKRLWEIACNLNKAFLKELRRNRIVPINDESSIKSFCKKHRRKGSKWMKSDLLPLASDSMLHLS